MSTLVTPNHPGRLCQMAQARGPVQIVLVGLGWPLTDYIEHYDTKCRTTDHSTNSTGHRKPTKQCKPWVPRTNRAGGPSLYALLKVGQYEKVRKSVLNDRGDVAPVTAVRNSAVFTTSTVPHGGRDGREVA